MVKPMDVTETPWIGHGKDIMSQFIESEIVALKNGAEIGKWMLFYNNTFLNEEWNKAVKLYDLDLLKGIICMKCSTAFENPRANNHIDGVIIFYCIYDENTWNIGERLKKIFEYDKNMYYKTNRRSREGTGATGCKKNHDIVIPFSYF
jgi:hypothetical protein